MEAVTFHKGQEVLFRGAMCINVIITLKPKTAIVWEKSTKKAHIKRLSSLKPFVKKA
jgi:hypothetical protein